MTQRHKDRRQVKLKSIHDILVWPVTRAVEIAHDTPSSGGSDKRRYPRSDFLAQPPDVPTNEQLSLDHHALDQDMPSIPVECQALSPVVREWNHYLRSIKAFNSITGIRISMRKRAFNLFREMCEQVTQLMSTRNDARNGSGNVERRWSRRLWQQYPSSPRPSPVDHPH